MSSLTLIQFQSRNLDPIDLVVAAGECVTLAGPSGSGKSLLLRALADLDPHGGEALVGKDAQGKLSPPDWRRRVGLIPTESHWWFPQVGQHFQNIDQTILFDLGFEQGCLEWEVGRLSSGERQRLALARLLSNRPEVLLLDEPTANLDAENCQRVEEIIEHYRTGRGCGVLWVSHSLEQRRRISGRSYLINGAQLEPELWT